MYQVYFQLENLSRADPPYKSVAALNCVILGCANIWDLDRAYQTFEAIGSSFGLTPDIHSYNALMYAFGKLKKVGHLMNESPPLSLPFYVAMYLLVHAYVYRYTHALYRCTHALTQTHVMHVHSSFMWVSSHFLSRVMHVILVLLIIYLVKIPIVPWLDHCSNICWRGKTNFGEVPGTNSFFPFVSKFGWGLFVSDYVRSRQQPSAMYFQGPHICLSHGLVSIMTLIQMQESKYAHKLSFYLLEWF